MKQPNELFPTRRTDGLERLQTFVPTAGRAYAAKRNTDPGPGLRDNVSMLSPYIRYRLIPEREVVAAVLEQHTPEQAEKFIQEVFWRTYWKGWLQMRPQVWFDYLAERDEDRDRVEQNSGLRTALAEAESGRTGIECLDDWANELVETGYLHNHARMWFASIWIFTLKLPWTLGADFFLRNLVDADPASNTLGWRWVAGIQTRGKTYLARPDNIAKYTDERYQPTGLATEAPPIREEEPYAAEPIAPLDPIPRSTPALLLLHPEDLTGAEHLPGNVEVTNTLLASSFAGKPDWPFGDNARTFLEGATEDAARAVHNTMGNAVNLVQDVTVDELSEHAQRSGAACIVTPDAPVGPIDTALQDLAVSLEQQGIKLHRYRRDWDAAAWPHAKKGFFPFKKAIPKLLERAGLHDGLS